MASMMPTFLELLLCALFAFPLTSGTAAQSGSRVGVVHGYHGNNLPSHQDVVNLAKHYGIRRMRTFGPDQSLFQALQGSNIELVLGVPNPDLQQIANDQYNANAWVQNNVKNFQQNIKFRYIVVGNGVSPLDRDNSQYVQFLMPALRNIQQAMTQTGCANNIKVTTAIDHHELVIETSQPSQATFRPEIRSFLDQLLDILSKNNAPLLVNLHPFYSYSYDRAEIPGSLNQGQSGSSDRRLDYAIFRAPGTVVQDGNVNYQNAFHAMLDNVYSALEKVGKGSMDVVVSEIGWPTAGANGASQENARAFNNNLLQNVQGTPKRPNKSIEAYIFTMFDENKKSTELQRNWGIFYANQQPKYSINFSGQSGQQNKN